MMVQTLDSKAIDTLRDLPDLMPVYREYYTDWNIRVFNRQQNECRNYLSPNRRDFYKILLTTKGTGVFTIGLNTYYVDEPTILFIHPNDIISWKNLTPGEGMGYYVLFKKDFVNEHLQLKTTIDKHALFTDKKKSVIRLEEPDIPPLSKHFVHMLEEDESASALREEAMQAYLQLLIIESIRVAHFPEPDHVSDDYKHVHEFFTLLEKETSNINISTPIRMRTAKEFAASLDVHPNHLNALLKKHTGQNVSTHIKSRLLEQAKVLLLQTDWTLQDIAYSIGFTEQPNFNLFFKK
ncbi:MAG TPA: AraC family transcriptional regulator, partial [Ohtaekwangia sp.]|uniref:AraC family transcriptional regulator n=1 Tax=Ohtaekwangia sp. TaxID=2066019 RepID=UPI002F935DE3